MTKPNQNPSYSWILGPGEDLPPLWPPYPNYYCRTPPFCMSPTPQCTWRGVQGAALQGVPITLKTQDDQVRVASRWVEQLVRKELGPALVKAEKKAKRRLLIPVSAEAADLMEQALLRKAKAGYGK